MSDDFDEIFDELMASQNKPGAMPTHRATIRNGRVMLTGWAPWLITGGPSGQVLKARGRAGVAIADLTLEGKDTDELIVNFLSPGRSLEEAEAAIIEWAGSVGYRRVWLSNRLVELEPDPERIATAEVRCPTCRSHWIDSTPEFWLNVHESRAFPHWCPLCGHEMPEWKLQESKRPAPRGPADRRGSQHASGRAVSEKGDGERPTQS